MSDRKLRTIAVLSLLTGITVLLLLIVLYRINLPGTISVPIMMVYLILQFRLSGYFFQVIYRSRLVDLPSFLKAKFPPPGFNPEEKPCDVLLLRPPSAVLSAPDCGEALGLGYLASTLRSNAFHVAVIDPRLQGLDVMQTVELILAYEPPAIGINLNFQYLAPVTGELLRALRSRKFMGHITLGGLYASVASEYLLHKMPEVNSVVRFEGEETYLELMKNLINPGHWPKIAGLVYRDQENYIQANPLRALISDLRQLPHPSRDYLDLAVRQGGYAYITASRGCRGSCTYCVQQRSVTDPEGRRWRGRDPKDVVDEIGKSIQIAGGKFFSFVDDDLFGIPIDGKTIAERIAQEIIDRGIDISILISVQPRDVEIEKFTLLKRAGLEGVILAVDNFSQPVLDRYKKYSDLEDNLRSMDILFNLDIDAYLGIIMFDPLTTLEELENNFRVMMDIPPYLRPWQILSKLEIYYGSPFTQMLEEKGLLRWEGYFAKYDYADPSINGVYSGLEVIVKACFPAMEALDSLRWGNLDYSKTDQWVIDQHKAEIQQINIDFNRQILGIALEIVQTQKAHPEGLSAAELVPENLEEKAISLNQKTLFQLNALRKQAKEGIKVTV